MTANLKPVPSPPTPEQIAAAKKAHDETIAKRKELMKVAEAKPSK